AMVHGIPDKVRGTLSRQSPLRLFGTVEEVGRAVVYLVSSDGDYITGAELSINGGLLMQRARPTAAWRGPPSPRAGSRAPRGIQHGATVRRTRRAPSTASPTLRPTAPLRPAGSYRPSEGGGDCAREPPRARGLAP